MKEIGKITKYQHVTSQVQKLWNVKGTVIPVIVGTLETISEELENHLKTIDIPIVISCLQNAALLGTVFILRRVPGISESMAYLSDIQAFFSLHAMVMLYPK